MNKQPEFNFMPEKEEWIAPEPVWFFLETDDGAKIMVKFSYMFENCPHFELYGEISDTGYRSYFPGYGVLPEEDIRPLAVATVNKCHREFLEETKGVFILKKGERYVHWYNYEGLILTDDYTQTLKQKRKKNNVSGE